MHKPLMQQNSWAPRDRAPWETGCAAGNAGEQGARGEGDISIGGREAPRVSQSLQVFLCQLPTATFLPSWHLLVPAPEPHLLPCTLLSGDPRTHSHASSLQRAQSRAGMGNAILSPSSPFPSVPSLPSAAFDNYVSGTLQTTSFHFPNKREVAFLLLFFVWCCVVFFTVQKLRFRAVAPAHMARKQINQDSNLGLPDFRAHGFHHCVNPNQANQLWRNVYLKGRRGEKDTIRAILEYHVHTQLLCDPRQIR